MNKKIAILATGANGSCAAADLVRAGLDVTMIDQWPAHVETMRADGLRIEMEGEVSAVTGLRAHHLCDVATFHDHFDIVLLMSKAYDAVWHAELIKPYLADDGLLVGVQNGMTAEDLATVVGPERTLGCVVELSSELFEPGIVKRNTPPGRTWFGVGALDPSMRHRESEVLEVLRHIGKADACDDIISAKWMKLIVNVMTMAIRSVTGMTSGELLAIDGVREVMLRSGSESLVVGQALGYRTVPIMGMSQEDVQSNRFLDLLLDKLLGEIGMSNKTTMYQDVLKGRRTEVDLMNGFVADASRRQGFAAPVNETLTEMTNAITRGELEPDPVNLERVMSVMRN